MKRQSDLAQKIYDWADKYSDYDWRNDRITWRRSLFGWIASTIHPWLRDHFDIIPF